MGCDSHILLEIKHEGGDWQLWQKRSYVAYADTPGICNHEIDCLSARDYDFFSVIAGVRASKSDQLYPTRGIPKDACAEVKEWYDERGYHSLTYLSQEEMLKCFSAVYDINKQEHVAKHYCQKQTIYMLQTAFYDSSFNRSTLAPILLAYANECAEAMLLGFQNPDIRFIIGFDS